MMMRAIALVVGGALAASTAQAAGEEAGKGYNCLFIGHSFFVPVAGKLPRLAAAEGLANHKQTAVFSGGATGTPLALWNNAALSSEIKEELDTGDVELFGMTYEGSDPTTEGYERWIEYALSKNKDTIFMVGIPWGDFPAGVDTATYTAEYRTWLSEGMTALFAGLRATFPGVTIIENIYGTAAVELRLLFDQGKLPDIKQLTGDKATSIFQDSKGHAGAMLLDLAPLLFLKRIYGVDPSKVSSDFSAYSTDLKAVAQSVLDAQDAQDAFRFCAPSDASCPGRSGCTDDDAALVQLAAAAGHTVAGCADPKVAKANACGYSQVADVCCATCATQIRPVGDAIKSGNPFADPGGTGGGGDGSGDTDTGEGGTSTSGCVVRRGHRVRAALVAAAAAVLCNV